MPASLLLLVSLLAPGTASLGPGDHARSIRVDDIDRRYLVHVPAAYDPTVPMPVVIAFHGGGGNAAGMAEMSGLSEKADAAGFIVVYPDGTGRLPRVLTFNAGDCCGQAAARNVDDVGFTRALLDDLATVVAVDARRVYATGMSNGAMMAHRVGAELSDRIAAIAPVAGPLGVESCAPGRPVPVIHFHGDSDEFAPFAGGRGRGVSATSFRSVGATIAAWVEADGCAGEPETPPLDDHEDDGTRVRMERHRGGREGAEVVLVVIEGGGHTWPGREPRLKLLGRSTREIAANDLMWEFFKRHPMP